MRYLMSVTLVIGALLACPSTSHALFAFPETKDVPTERLLNNLETKLSSAQTKKEQAGYHYYIARVHSIAAFNGQEITKVTAKSEVPFLRVGPSKDLPPGWRNRKQKAVKDPTQHLRNAIKHYEAAIKSNPTHLPSQLGLGWCYDQQGTKPKAITHYKQALALAWEKEEKANHIFEFSWVQEIVRYLEPLLDKQKDAEFIKKMNTYKKAMAAKPRAITPILVPLGEETDLKSLVNPTATVAFDLDGSGLDRHWGWINPNAAWIVHDPSQEGNITSGLQLIGNVTFWVFWDNGYQVLQSLDNNADGELSGNELTGLSLWHDANSNGKSEPGEVRTMKEHEIRAVATDWSRHPSGIPFNPKGITLESGTTLPSYDWIAPETTP